MPDCMKLEANSVDSISCSHRIDWDRIDDIGAEI